MTLDTGSPTVRSRYDDERAQAYLNYACRWYGLLPADALAIHRAVMDVEIDRIWDDVQAELDRIDRLPRWRRLLRLP